MGKPLTFVPCRENNDIRCHYIPTNIVGCAFQIGRRAYLVVGNHWIVGCSWHCLEDLQTGLRYDIQWTDLDNALNDAVNKKDDRVKRLNAMETLAWTAR